jgi:hypothetical protein
MTKSHYRSAEQLLVELGITSPTDIDIEAIAQYCGATVVYEPLEGCEARILGIGDRAVITVNESSSRKRQRFSAGHELGHWMHDRGRASFACDDVVFHREWSRRNTETRANEYSADLLLPVSIFKPLARDREITITTTRELATAFETSLTATAIRMVEHGSFPSMVVCNGPRGRLWFKRGPSIPENLWPTDRVGPSTVAFDILRGDAPPGKAVDVNASAWFDSEGADSYWVREDAVRVAPDTVLSLIWWADEQQLLDLESDDPDTSLDLRFR